MIRNNFSTINLFATFRKICLGTLFRTAIFRTLLLCPSPYLRLLVRDINSVIYSRRDDLSLPLIPTPIWSRRIDQIVPKIQAKPSSKYSYARHVLMMHNILTRSKLSITKKTLRFNLYYIESDDTHKIILYMLYV